MPETCARAVYARPDKLFELLDFCGIRQQDIVQRLGVSKALVSLWRSGQRGITPKHRQALQCWIQEDRMLAA